MKYLKRLLFGRHVSGERIIDKQPRFTTQQPSQTIPYNIWIQLIHTNRL